MQEFLRDIFMAVITAAVPVLTAYIVVLIRKVGDNAAANAESVTTKTYITEVTEAIAAAVSATNQTYVDSLKNAGRFDAAAQREAAQKALEACLASHQPSGAELYRSRVWGHSGIPENQDRSGGTEAEERSNGAGRICAGRQRGDSGNRRLDRFGQKKSPGGGPLRACCRGIFVCYPTRSIPLT